MGDVDTSPLHALEAAALRAWPALEEEVVHGWRLRFAGGYTRRANAVSAQADAAALDAGHLEDIERRYRERRLPPVFRLVGFSPMARALDATLEARGYRRADPCLVMAAPLPAAAPARGEGPTVATRALDAWLDAFRDITGQVGDELSLHGRLLGAIDGPLALAVDAGDAPGTPDSCAVGVVAEGTLGLFDVATRPAARGRGGATRLCGQLMAWGRVQGARQAWLQVLASNTGARRVYERLGFRTAYEYWYRERA